MKALVILLLFALLFISQINTIVSIDLWWNLKTGEYIVRNLEIPRVDIFSYTLKDTLWIDHEWLSQILLYFVFSRFGWVGLNIFKAVTISLCFLILFSMVFSKYKKIIPPVFFILLGILAFGYRSFVRPEIFSYLFLCIFFYVLEKEKRICILPFLQLVWVNLHGYFILGPILIFLYWVGEFFSGDRDKAKRIALIFLWSMLACFINPYFYTGAIYPFKVVVDVFTKQRLFMETLHELMMPIRSGVTKYIFFWVFAMFASMTFLVNLKNVKLKHILLFGLSFFASYMAIRNMPVFIFLGMGLASMNLSEARFPKQGYGRKHLVFIIVVISGLIYMFMSNRYYIFTNQAGMRKTESRFSRLFMPSGACDFLKENNIKGRMFNTLDFGPYIGYRFYPERRIFIDSRLGLFDEVFYELYRNAQNYPDEWQKVHDRYGFNIVLLRHLFSGTERLQRYLYNHDDWRLVYYDVNSVIFLNDIPVNRAAIDRFEIDVKKRGLLAEDIDIRIARFFDKLGEFEMAEKIYIKLLEKDPRFLEAGNNLATIYINTDRLDKGLELIKRFISYYPRSAELYANLGTCYLRMGKEDKGLLMLERSAKIDPYFRKASYMLGLVYLKTGDIDRAQRQFVKYSRLDPYDPEGHEILGDIYRQKGLLKKAELEYNEANALKGI